MSAVWLPDSGLGESVPLLFPPHRYPLQKDPQGQSIRLVAGEDLADQSGAKEREVEVAADEGGVQADGLGDHPGYRDRYGDARAS